MYEHQPIIMFLGNINSTADFSLVDENINEATCVTNAGH